MEKLFKELENKLVEAIENREYKIIDINEYTIIFKVEECSFAFWMANGKGSYRLHSQDNCVCFDLSKASLKIIGTELEQIKEAHRVVNIKNQIRSLESKLFELEEELRTLETEEPSGN